MQTHTIGGYQTRWHLRKPQLRAVSAGSVYQLTANGADVPREIVLGEYRQEGMGRIRLMKENELTGTAKSDEVKANEESAGGKATGLISALRALAAQEYMRQSADNVFHKHPEWADKANNGVMGRIRQGLKDSESAEQLKVMLEQIGDNNQKKHDKKDLAIKVFTEIYGSGSNSDVLEHMLGINNALYEAVRNDSDATNRVLTYWKRPMLQLLHTIYFNKPKEGEQK